MGLRLLRRGKVREIYVDDDQPDEVILVASDRVSVYDVVLPTPIPHKGAVLTALSVWWFEQVADLVPNHVLSADVPSEFVGRAVRCRRVDIVPVECIARGYLAGLGLESYQSTGTISGVRLPPGLVEGGELPHPVFTPTTKAAPGEGHDEFMTRDQVRELVGDELTDRLERLTLDIYRRGAKLARSRGVILADTKLEFGHAPDGALLLADELLTPDSSRYWRIEDWHPGRRQSSYDKQHVRDWARDLGWWNRTPPGPEVPAHVVAETSRRYVEIYERLTGRRWQDPGTA